MNLEVAYSLGTERFLDAFSKLAEMTSKRTGVDHLKEREHSIKEKAVISIHQPDAIIDGAVSEILIKWTVRENLRRGTQQRKRNTEMIY